MQIPLLLVKIHLPLQPTHQGPVKTNIPVPVNRKFPLNDIRLNRFVYKGPTVSLTVASVESGTIFPSRIPDRKLTQVNWFHSERRIGHNVGLVLPSKFIKIIYK